MLLPPAVEHSRYGSIAVRFADATEVVGAQVGFLTDDVTAPEDRMSFTNVVSLRDPTIKRVCYHLSLTSLKWLT